MPSFEAEFRRSRGQPITYRSQILQLFDRFPLLGCQQLWFVVEQTQSVWRQGAVLRLKGLFIVNECKIRDSIVLWEDSAPPEVDIQVQTQDEHILIHNVWDRGNGVLDAWHNGAAMKVDELKNGRRYYCNDGHPDENFTDIVFRLERVAAAD